MDPLDELFFEAEFQKFWTQGFYTDTKDEDWERQAAQTEEKKPPSRCPHGKTLLTCHECYFDQR